MFQFEQYHQDRCSQLTRGIPPHTESAYFYDPKPMDAEIPISRHEFYDRFYGRVTSCQGTTLGAVSQRDGCDCGSHETVDRIPQRIRGLDQESRKGRRPHVWGIVAREKKSRLKLLVWIILTSVPGYIFFFMWLFAWDHDSLQDASSLLVLTFSFWAILFAAQMV